MPEKKKRRTLDIWNKLAVMVLTLFLVGCISVFFVLVNVINDPEGMRFTKDGLATLQNSRIYDAQGNVISELGSEIREDVSYKQIPQTVIDAFLSIEDSRYFDHNGFDLPRFLAAAMHDLRSGSFSQGGSTLTMQMIDNAFTKNQEDKIKNETGTSLSRLQKLKLKVQEIYLSLIAEQNLNKEQIFEYYVNRIWFGSSGNTRGIQKASQYYFGKDVSDLNLEESAFLAGCINAPATYNPLGNINDDKFDHLQAAQNRRNATLDLMLQHGYISQVEHDLAVNTKLSFNLKPSLQTTQTPNDSYIYEVIKEVQTLTGQDPAVVPMDIYTALDQDLQNQADQICAGNVIPYPDEAFDLGFGIIDNKTGQILAMGPGRTYHTDEVKINNAYAAKNPGSSNKPLLAYSSTFDILGWSTEHTVNDVAKDYWKNGTTLNNSDHTYAGKISLTYALAVSKNTTAAQAMLDLIDAKGYNYWIEFCKKLGYDNEVAEKFNPQYAIGGSDIYASPIQQGSAYTIFANGGKRITPHTIIKAIRRSDKKTFKPDTTPIQVISEQAAYLMSVLLYRVVHAGYYNFNNFLVSDYPIYGKSGTSDWGDLGLAYGIPEGSIRDEWSVGYTKDYTIAIWSGYTPRYQQQGWYIPTAQVTNYAMAFKVNHYLFDYLAQTKRKPEEIKKPTTGVSEYKGGYIETKYLDKGDQYSNYEDEQKKAQEQKEIDEFIQACEADGGTYDAASDSCIYTTTDNSNTNNDSNQTSEPTTTD